LWGEICDVKSATSARNAAGRLMGIIVQLAHQRGYKMKLYEIAGMLQQAIDACLEQAEQAEGEITEDWSAFLDDVKMERDEKALGIADYIKGELAEAEAIKKEKDALAKRQKTHENRAESLKAYLSAYIKEGDKITGPHSVIAWRASKAVRILDEAALPECYWKIERTPMKAEIKDAIKNGAVVPGAEVVEKQSIQIK
jgi:hypothetical protein